MRGGVLIPGSFRDRSIYVGPTAAPWNAPSPLVMPSPYSTNEFVHPDVVFVPRGWNGYRYWMGVTPYPLGADGSENPSVLCSNDRINWVVPPGGTNPVVANMGGYNSDTDLEFDASTGTMYLIWRQVAGVEMFKVVSSTNGATWSDPVLMWSGADMLSPCLVKVGSTWFCYYVDNAAPVPARFAYRTAPAITGPWSATSTQCIYPTPMFGAGEYNAPWHVNAFRHNNLTYLLSNENGPSGRRNLRLAVSADGTSFTPAAQPLMATITTSTWDNGSLYRAGALVEPGGKKLWVWYSATGSLGWQVGYTEIPTDNPSTFPVAP